MKKKKVILVIMDGWGLAKPDKFNAIENANTPNFDSLVKEYPNTRLKSDGLSVGLPEGQFGTSEVNHLTIGSGRIIFQDLPKINKAIEDESFYNNVAMLKTINHAVKNKSKLHLIGILSDGKVHTTIDHLFAIFEMLKRHKFVENVYLHLFTDGRDVAPQSAEKYFKLLEKEIKKYKELKISIATIQGRFYLDRDREWSKTEQAFELIAKGKGTKNNSPEAVINSEYKK